MKPPITKATLITILCATLLVFVYPMISYTMAKKPFRVIRIDSIQDISIRGIKIISLLGTVDQPSIVLQRHRKGNETLTFSGRIDFTAQSEYSIKPQISRHILTIDIIKGKLEPIGDHDNPWYSGKLKAKGKLNNKDYTVDGFASIDPRPGGVSELQLFTMDPPIPIPTKEKVIYKIGLKVRILD
ncbi:hypothetical protein BVX98_06015 [bacterium F11]|nr:hypothetical protein BVX98_06015 [bacterium F11]